MLSSAETRLLRFVENSDVKSELRLAHRYLDLRRPDMQQNIIKRSMITNIARNYFAEHWLIDIETPCLIKPRPRARETILSRAASTTESSTLFRSLLSFISSFSCIRDLTAIFR